MAGDRRAVPGDRRCAPARVAARGQTAVGADTSGTDVRRPRVGQQGTTRIDRPDAATSGRMSRGSPVRMRSPVAEAATTLASTASFVPARPSRTPASLPRWSSIALMSTDLSRRARFAAQRDLATLGRPQHVWCAAPALVVEPSGGAPPSRDLPGPPRRTPRRRARGHSSDGLTGCRFWQGQLGCGLRQFVGGQRSVLGLPGIEEVAECIRPEPCRCCVCQRSRHARAALPGRSPDGVAQLWIK